MDDATDASVVVVAVIGQHISNEIYLKLTERKRETARKPASHTHSLCSVCNVCPFYNVCTCSFDLFSICRVYFLLRLVDLFLACSLSAYVYSPLIRYMYMAKHIFFLSLSVLGSTMLLFFHLSISYCVVSPNVCVAIDSTVTNQRTNERSNKWMDVSAKANSKYE